MSLNELTIAEARILELVASGLSTKQIATIQWVSVQAVTYHIGHLLQKLDASNRAGLVARAYVSGILDTGHWPPKVTSRTPHHRIHSKEPSGDWEDTAPDLLPPNILVNPYGAGSPWGRDAHEPGG